MHYPLVSILVPIYNVESYIERCARSLFEQTYDNIEYIFVDDCTPDKSMLILQEIIKDYPHRADQVRIIRHKHNRGLAAARNTLVDNAKGEFVMHVDSDDWMEMNAVALVVTKQQESGADIVTGQVTAHYDNKKVLHMSWGWNLDKEDLLVNIMNKKSRTSIWGRLIRRSLYTQTNIRCWEGADCSEDFQVFPCLLYYACNIAGINEIIYHYNCINRRSYTHLFTKNNAMHLQILSSRKVVSDFFSDKNIYIKQLCDSETARIIHYMMICNLQNRNKQGYYFFYRKLVDDFKPYWAIVGWNNDNKRLAEGHFGAMYLKYTICRIKNKIKQITSYA